MMAADRGAPLKRARNPVHLLARAGDYSIHMIAAAVLVVLLIVVLLQVYSRFIIKQPIPWTEEEARYFLIWFGLLGATLAARNGTHFRVNAIGETLSPVVRKYVYGLGYAITAATLGFLFVLGVRITLIEQQESSIVLHHPMSLVYVAIPAGALLMLVYHLVRWVRGAE